MIIVYKGYHVYKVLTHTHTLLLVVQLDSLIQEGQDQLCLLAYVPSDVLLGSALNP